MKLDWKDFQSGNKDLIMKKGKGKNKGNSFQWSVCKSLSLAWTDGERDDIFCPSQSSGARATQRHKSGKETKYQSSDITFSDPIGEPLIRFFNIECKTGYGRKSKDSKGQVVKTNWDLLDLLDSKQSDPVILSFWKQCKEDALKNNTEPILIFRRNNRGTCICFPFSMEGNSNINITKIGSVVEETIPLEKQLAIFLNFEKDNAIVMGLNYFLKNFMVPLKKYIEKVNNHEKEKEENIQPTCRTETSGEVRRIRSIKRKTLKGSKRKES